MDLETYARSKRADYAALADTVASILRAAIAAHPDALRLQQVQHRAKSPDSLRKKLENRSSAATTSLETEIKDLAGCRLIFYTNSDVSRFLQTGIIQDNFDIDWDRTKIHHPVPGHSDSDNLFISNNYVLKLKDGRTALPEYARFSGMWCEVQIQTTLNHAWSEMEHDIIYKKPALEGFGGKLFEAIEQRLQRIMRTHLLPAGYEFQKVLDDYERLLGGKALLDRGALRALAECDDNNARRELLDRFRDYVLPNYDDPQRLYPEIKSQLVAAVKAARLTKLRPIETPFGSYPGITVARIVDIVADILTQVRYLDVEITFDALCELFPGSQSDEERQHLIGVAERLSQHNLDVWKQAGPYVQTVLVQKIRKMVQSEVDALRPVLLKVLGEVLKAEVHGISSTYRTVTFGQASAVPSDALARTRTETIELLMSLYRTASSDVEKRRTQEALFEATRTPSGSNYSNELLVCILQNSVSIVDFFSEIATTESYEILQTLENRLLWMYRRNQSIPGTTLGDAAVVKARDRLTDSILNFRDVANSSKGFTTYKTLVGFESVFRPAWDDPNFDPAQEAAYREQRVSELVAEVNETNADEWFAIIQRCAQTESDDLATFPSFGQFLQQLSQAKPQLALGFIDRMDEPLTRFLGVILSGLAQSSRRADMEVKIAEWLAQEKHLSEMAHYVQIAREFDPTLLKNILAISLKRKEDRALMGVLSAVARRYGEGPKGLIETTFLPAVEYFSEKSDARWVNLVWHIPKERSPLSALTAEQADVVLGSLIHLRKIEFHAERVLDLIAQKYPQKAFDFLVGRLQFLITRGGEDGYEEIPFHFQSLTKAFANIADYAVDMVRQRFSPDDPLFQFRGGRLLANSFPDYPETFSRKLLTYVHTDNREDIEFVTRVMSSYHGQTFLNETCKEVARALPPDDALLRDVEVILQSTGVVSGEFGFVEAYKRKKVEIATWLNDADSHVRKFAEGYVLLLDRSIAAEQRRSEESIEMRKRMYGDSDGDKEV